MKWLCIGDIVSSPGRSAVRDYLDDASDDYDLIVANAENAAGGVGLTADVAETILGHGVDVLTSGNHIWKKSDFVELMAESPDEYPVLRPANYPKNPPGRGHRVFKVNGQRVLILNLQGRTFMDSIDCPFQEADRILNNENYDLALVDFHAEATSEKISLAKYVADRVTAFVGTHTHVQTADDRIIDGMAYLSDLGMTGPQDSIIGVRDELATKRFLTGRPIRFKVEKQGPRILNALSITVDADVGRADSLQRIYEEMPQRQH
ncbi:MAG: YmdB family metallophosphoesterase [bacterium]